MTMPPYLPLAPAILALLIVLLKRSRGASLPVRRYSVSVFDRPVKKYRALSLRGRLAVALVCFERHCVAKGLQHDMLDAFVTHMWEYPCIESFPAWASNDTDLVCVGLGDPFPNAMASYLDSVGEEQEDFRRLVESCVEIVYGSAYSAADDKGSLQDLEKVISITSESGVTPPPAKPFMISLFADDHGWGTCLSAEQRDAWRFRAYDNQMA
jgi:hypothetical protein